MMNLSFKLCSILFNEELNIDSRFRPDAERDFLCDPDSRGVEPTEERAELAALG